MKHIYVLGVVGDVFSFLDDIVCLQVAQHEHGQENREGNQNGKSGG
jgi:hypothetical protein